MNPIRLPRAKSFLLASASALALTIAAPHAHAGPLSEHVMSAGATGPAPNPTSPIPGLPTAVSTQAQAQAAQAQTTANLATAAARLQAALTAQANARAAAQAGPNNLGPDPTHPGTQLPNVPDGLVTGGLNPDGGLASSGTANPVITWVGANTPTQTASNGQTTVTVNQTQQAAILNWQTFNVGKKTTVNFVQKDSTGVDQTSWVALNKVNDPAAVPSQILGQINAPGSVYIVNRNGVIFGGTSQINVHSLVAAATDFDNTQFLANGIYSTQTGSTYNPVFANAGGNITVEAGANIQTAAPTSVTAGGGFVMLLGQAVENDGSITTPVGQTVLAAGDNFFIRPGASTDGANPTSTTNGSEVAVSLNAGSTSGAVTNAGYIYSPEGDITLVGHTVLQDGIAVSTTSVATRGTIHLLNSISDTTGTVTFGPNALTDVMPELDSTDTALNSQRVSPAPGQSAMSAQFDDVQQVYNDLTYDSLIDVVTGGTAEFQGQSLSLANGGEIYVTATNRIQTDKGASLDVSGVNVALPVSVNALQVNIQGNEERDDPNNRDDGSLFNADVYVDERDLIYVPAGTGGYTTDRDYTPGGLLEVSGELANVGHTIGEWTASGGSITLGTGSSGSIVAQEGSDFNLSGGSIAYQGGRVPTSWLIGSDGGIYNINTAPADVTYTGLANSFQVDHSRWVATDNYSSGIFAPSSIYEADYVVGRDAGTIVVASPTVLFNGNVDASVVAGTQQTGVRPSAITDPFLESQTTAPLSATLVFGPVPGQIGLLANFYTPSTVVIGDGTSAGDSLSATDAIPEGYANTILLSADELNSFGLGGMTIETANVTNTTKVPSSITINAPLVLADGGTVNLDAPTVTINADVTAHGGSLTAMALYDGGTVGVSNLVTVAPGVTLDTTGLWTNAVLDPKDLGGLAFVNGGAVNLTSNGDVILGTGSLIDASSGAALLAGDKEVGGNGGDISLIAGYTNTAIQESGAELGLLLDGDLRSYGVVKGGGLTIQTPSVIVGGNVLVNGTLLPAGATAPTDLVLTSGITFPAGAIRGVATVLSQAATFDVGSTLPFSVDLSTSVTFSAGSTLPVSAFIVARAYASGEALPSRVDTPGNNADGNQAGNCAGCVTTAAAWTVPSGALGVFYSYPAPNTTSPRNGNPTAYIAGDTIPAGTILQGGQGNLPAGYVIPANVFPQGWGVLSSINLPAGSVLTSDLTLPAGYAWAAGIPLPVAGTLPAGALLPAGAPLQQPVTVAAGSMILAGEVAPEDTSVIAPLELQPSFFQQGFSSYSINGTHGLTVSDGTDIAAVMPVLRFTGISAVARTGTNPEDALQLWQPPLNLANPKAATLAQRGGASISLSAVPAANDAQALLDSEIASGPTLSPLSIGNGAIISVDPGQAINLSAWGELDLEGSLKAPGGTVSVLNTRQFELERSPDLSLSVWIGSSASIDVAGEAVTALDQNGRTYGIVPNGGSITLGSAGGTPDPVTGVVPSTDAFIIVRPGATLDASGTNATLDLSAGLAADKPSDRVAVSSNGGSIAISSNSGLYLDGNMLADAGGAGAAGGSLSLTLVAPIYSDRRLDDSPFTLPTGAAQARVLTVNAQSTPSAIDGGVAPGALSSEIQLGSGQIDVNQITAGGFDNLSLFGGDAIAFNGDVSLNLGQSLTLQQGRISLSSATPNAIVLLSAPYILLDGATGALANVDHANIVFIAQVESLDTQNGVLSINADLLDIENPVAFGMRDTITDASGGTQVVDLPNFATINLTSQGDIRFLAADNPLRAGTPFAFTSLVTTGNFNFAAQRIYPETDVAAYVIAGYPGVPPGNPYPLNPNGEINITRIGSGDVATPDSVFGHLLLLAANIQQGGVVEAPLGGLTIGSNGQSELGPYLLTPDFDNSSPMTQNVSFLPGSVTSVSANGLTIPYGGTSDGITYYYNGTQVTFTNAFDDLEVDLGQSGPGGGGPAPGINQGVTASGQSINIEPGSLLDLSGGGDVLGAGFISGRGGSIDALRAPLSSANPANSFSASSDQVYAIVPNYTGSYAPIAPEAGAGSPLVGEQVTIGSGVPGLAAGTYTLLPSTYALLPGAFRVEIGSADPTPITKALPDGSFGTGGKLGIANTTIQQAEPVRLILTSGTAVRDNSQYNETSYSDFATSQAAILDTPVPLLPIDAKQLLLDFGAILGTGNPLSVGGTVSLTPGSEDGQVGRSGTVTILDGGGLNATPLIEIRGPNETPTSGTLSLAAADIDSLNAGALVIGGWESEGSNGIMNIFGVNGGITIESGAELDAAQIILGGQTAENIVVQDGATLSTLGKGAAPWDSINDNILLQFGGIGLSNGSIVLSAEQAQGSIDSGATLLSEGTIVLAGGPQFTIGATPILGAKDLIIGGSSINIGSTDSLNNAQTAGILPAGWSLNQDTLNALINPTGGLGAPALQSLTLLGSNSVNIFGTVNLSTVDPTTGKSDVSLTLDTPAIYGFGNASDVATITTDVFSWNGVVNITANNNGPASVAVGSAGPVVPNGPGTGQGQLVVDANQIVLGFPSNSVTENLDSVDRLALGFSAVTLQANSEITGNNLGSLSVYQAQSTSGGVTTNSGGTLNLITPLLTTDAGAKISYMAGNALNIMAPAGTVADTSTVQTQGGEIDLSANSVSLDTAIALPSGKLSVLSQGDIQLGANADIDLSGRTTTIFDSTSYSWGGDVVLESTAGNITQDAAGVINVSATSNDAGSLSVTAEDASAGNVALAGQIIGSATSANMSGAVDIRANVLNDFAGLNDRLDTGGVFGSRSFSVNTGDLTVGNVTAQTVNISLNGGSLTIDGTIDASGPAPGAITLAAKNDLTLDPSAVLDAHGTVLQVDSYGQPIDAENRGHIELTATTGTMTLQPGATLNVSSPEATPQGDIELNVARGTPGAAANPSDETSGDAKINASGNLNITGAQTIAVNAFWSYVPTDANGSIIQDNLDPAGNPVAQSGADSGFVGLNQINVRDTSWVNAAINNPDLLNRLAGLSTYTNAFHLRPGVEIDSATPLGDLNTVGDLDFSGFRYASLNPNSQQTSIYGSGEPGSIVLRAGGNLNVNGSISDGFGPAVQVGIGPTTPTLVPYDSGTPLAQTVTFSSLPAPNTAIGESAGYSFFYFPGYCGATCSDATVVSGQVIDSASGHVFNPGQQIGYFSRGATFAQGTVISIAGQPSGTVIFSTTSLTPSDEPVAAVSAMLPAGALSWNMRLVAGADLKSADTRAVQPKSVLDASGMPAQVATVNVASGVALPVSITFSTLPTPNASLGESSRAAFFYFPGYFDGDPSEEPVVVAGGIQDPNQGFIGPGRHVGYFTQGTTFEAGTILSFPGQATGTVNISQIATIPAVAPKGNLVLNDALTSVVTTPIISVVRTGTGNLDLIAGESFQENSLYGVYTAGTKSSGVDPDYQTSRAPLADGTLLGANNAVLNAVDADYQAYYPTSGGDVLLKAQGDIGGYFVGTSDANADNTTASNAIGNWLWRQGGTGINQPAAWWINFGTFAEQMSADGTQQANSNFTEPDISLLGFTGVGTLGGGNLTVVAGGDAGITSAVSGNPNSTTTALDLFVGGSGRVSADGQLTQTGGGTLTLKVGGAINPDNTPPATIGGGNQPWGIVGDLRGNISIDAGAIGHVELDFGHKDTSDPRQQNPFSATTADSFGGLILAPGDSTVTLQTRGDLVLGTVADPGRAPLQNLTEVDANGTSSEAYSWFTLWRPTTAVNLVSVGGNVTPETVYYEADNDNPTIDGGSTEIFGDFVFPSTLNVTAASGSIYYGYLGGLNGERGMIELAPSASGQLNMIAANSIFGDGDDQGNIPLLWALSGAAPNTLATPQNPGYQASGLFDPTGSNGGLGASNFWTSLDGYLSLFNFGPDTATSEIRTPDAPPARFYAGSGDISELRYGDIAFAGPVFLGLTNPPIVYISGAPVNVEAGRDIVNFGTPFTVSLLNDSGSTPIVGSQATIGGGSDLSSFILNYQPSDVSVISAGRDILYANVAIGGPGDLDVTAGRNIYEGDHGLIESIGPVFGATDSNRFGGANVTELAGVGSAGPDLTDFANLYFNNANQANPSFPLDFPQNQGKVVQTYEDQLYAWLQQRFGYVGTEDSALAYFLALPTAQQQVFVLQVYFQELDASDVEFNTPSSSLFQSYVRGKAAITVLFPTENTQGQPIDYSGSVTMASGTEQIYGGGGGNVAPSVLWDSGVHTEFGGDINILTPGGATTVGSNGIAPGASTGLLTEGSGDINIYAEDSIPLGLSRVFTTFGGNITMWSATGDINAGRGAKGTVVFAPVRRTYDIYGDVALAPTVPTQGAGIATLAPILGVPPGNVYLVAPEGIIDAGEAGIRVSGNAFLAALQVVNAANIQVKGQAFGLPPKPVTNLSFTAASNASTEAANIVRQMATQRQTVISVEVTGFGGGDTDQPSECIPTATNRCN